MELPEDVISEIFSRLPAKSIFKFKSCCKSISNFTNNTYFALKQAQNMMLKGDSSLVIQGSIFPMDKYCTLDRFRQIRSVFTIWVLTDLESSSWSKFLSISLEEMGLEEDDPFVYDFKIMNGDSLVFISGSTRSVYAYDLIGARGKRLEKIAQLATNHYVSIIPYSNTLRSCGAGAKRFRRNHKELLPRSRKKY